MELKDSINYVKKAIMEAKLDIDDNTILSEAMDLFISDRIGELKKEALNRPPSMVLNGYAKNKAEPEEEMATPKQKSYMEMLGIRIDKDLTKKEASKLIENYKQNKGE